MKSIRAWLGVDTPEKQDFAPLRQTLEALDHLEPDRKLALMRCLFTLSATDDAISTAEEGEIHRIAKELRIDHSDLVALRVAYQRHLPGMSHE